MPTDTFFQKAAVRAIACSMCTQWLAAGGLPARAPRVKFFSILGDTTMGSEFSRIITLLRKEQGLSQKKAAADLGISQALLSHYEKGIRECGLNFVLKAAGYYGVSCDYLLGRTPHRSGAVFSMEDIPDSGSRDNHGSMAIEYNRRLIINSINIIFSVLEQIGHEVLTTEAASFFSCAVYYVYRALYSANTKNPGTAFRLDARTFESEIQMEMIRSAAMCKYLLSGDSFGGCPSIKKSELPLLTNEAVHNEYAALAPSLFDLIKNIEKNITAFTSKNPENA